MPCIASTSRFATRFNINKQEKYGRIRPTKTALKTRRVTKCGTPFSAWREPPDAKNLRAMRAKIY
jgi:hypothetical protein